MTYRYPWLFQQAVMHIMKEEIICSSHGEIKTIVSILILNSESLVSKRKETFKQFAYVYYYTLLWIWSIWSIYIILKDTIPYEYEYKANIIV